MTDFGISVHCEDGVCTSTSGTRYAKSLVLSISLRIDSSLRRPYMAPEVFLPGHKHNAIADYYSLGVTLFQLLVGQRPYPGSRRVLQHLVRMVNYVPPPSLTSADKMRKTLISAQQRRAQLPELQFLVKLARLPPACRSFIGGLLIANPRYRLGVHGADEVLQHEWLRGVDLLGCRNRTFRSPLLRFAKQTLPVNMQALQLEWSHLGHAISPIDAPPGADLPNFYFNINDSTSNSLNPEFPPRFSPAALAALFRRQSTSSTQSSRAATSQDDHESQRPSRDAQHSGSGRPVRVEPAAEALPARLGKTRTSSPRNLAKSGSRSRTQDSASSSINGAPKRAPTVAAGVQQDSKQMEPLSALRLQLRALHMTDVTARQFSSRHRERNSFSLFTSYAKVALTDLLLAPTRSVKAV